MAVNKITYNAIAPRLIGMLDSPYTPCGHKVTKSLRDFEKDSKQVAARGLTALLRSEQ